MTITIYFDPTTKLWFAGESAFPTKANAILCARYQLEETGGTIVVTTRRGLFHHEIKKKRIKLRPKFNALDVSKSHQITLTDFVATLKTS